MSMVCKAFHLVGRESSVIIFCSPTALAKDACPSPALPIAHSYHVIVSSVSQASPYIFEGLQTWNVKV